MEDVYINLINLCLILSNKLILINLKNFQKILIKYSENHVIKIKAKMLARQITKTFYNTRPPISQCPVKGLLIFPGILPANAPLKKAKDIKYHFPTDNFIVLLAKENNQK